MKTINILLLTSFVSILLFGCSLHKRSLEGTEKELAPGVTPINSVLMVDQTEMSNFHWLEYLYWTSRVFGAESQEYLNTLPKTDVWKEETCLEVYKNDYLRSPKYRDYPVVGISQQQAINFCKWRSDRVFEYILIKEGIIDFDTTQNADYHFTIERYFNGLYPLDSSINSSATPKKPNFDLLYPHYSLPTLEERKRIVHYTDSIGYEFQTEHPRLMNKLAEDKVRMLTLDVTPCDSNELLKDPTVPIMTGFPKRRNFDQIYNIRGNVAEWLNEEDLTAGGGWPHNTKYVINHDTISVFTPNAWTGFRCAFTWKKWGE